MMDDAKNNGGNTDYYAVPKDAETLNDLIEHKKMNFAQGNMFKAVYCLTDGRHKGTTTERELNKIIYYAEREKKRLVNYAITTVETFDKCLSEKEIQKIYERDM